MLDVAILGAGLSGTVAAAVLGRAGYSVGLIDRHTAYPPDFRAEHLDQPQAETLARLGLLDQITADVPCVRRVAVGRRGRLLGVWPTVNYGLQYDTLVNAARRVLPPDVAITTGRITDVEAGPVTQLVKLADGRVIAARLLIVATGMGYAISARLGVTRCVLHKGHSLTFGFDLEPCQGERFRYPFLVYQGERLKDRIDYLAAFEIGDSMRANLFTFRDYRDPWTHRMVETPEQTLADALPGLEKVLGLYRVRGQVQVRAMDLYVSEQFCKPGFVLVGDAFQTACPAAGKGMTRALTDVERLCAVHVPRWLETPGMGVEKIASFYADQVKQATDVNATHTAHYRRALATESNLRWRLHRQRLFAQALARGLAQRLLPGPQDQAA